MKKRNVFLTVLMITVLVFSSVAGSYAAATEASKRKEAAEATQKAEAAAKKAEEETQKAEALEEKFYELEKEVKEQKEKVKKTETKIAKKEKEINNQTEALNDRLTAMYKTGSIGFIDVILNSEGIEDLLSNMGMVSMILKSDQELLADLEEDLAEVEELKAKQVSQKNTLESKQAEVEETRKACIAAAKKYEAKEEELRAEADKLAKEADKLAREAEQSGSFVPTPGGQYAWPTDANYYFTSWYGWRLHPIFQVQKYHSGYDICLYGGSYGKPLYAVGDGVVTMSSTYGGYGNCLMISIGNGYTTLYGHLSSFAVSAGQTVKKGQVVGYIGSTGWSTGPHLHFSLLKNGDLVDPMILY